MQSRLFAARVTATMKGGPASLKTRRSLPSMLGLTRSPSSRSSVESASSAGASPFGSVSSGSAEDDVEEATAIVKGAQCLEILEIESIDAVADAVIEGCLEKRRSSVKAKKRSTTGIASWQRRWFVLCAHYLGYKDKGGSGPVKAILDLWQFEAVQLAVASGRVGHNSATEFILYSRCRTVEGGRWVWCGSREERELWVVGRWLGRALLFGVG